MRSIVGSTLLLVALANAGCRTMRPVTLKELSGLNADRAWVTEADTSVVIVFVPQVVGDTLAGYVNGQFRQLPSAAVKQVTVLRPAPMRTALLVAGITVGMGGLFAALSGSGEYKMPSSISGAPGDCEKHPEDPICQGHP